jgi:hypothetical protein
MTLQVHLIVQDAADFDDPPFFDRAMEEQVTPAPAMPGDMECSHT